MPNDEYKQITIRDTISKIERGEIFLPAIQRHFVWTPTKIEKLFDSIMLGYPIGTFLFWTVSKEYINDHRYSIYRFIQNYHERDSFLNERVGNPINHIDEIITVLDGQQRISSLYMALKGTIAFKKPKARRDNNNAYPEKQLYLNLVNEKNIDDDDSEGNKTFDFRFMSDEEYNRSLQDEVDLPLEKKHHIWFLVKQVLNWKQPDDLTDYVMDNGWLANKSIVGYLMRLWHRICEESIINYFEVKNNNLDDVLDVFVRVNSGGVILSKTDLLFSTIVSQWDDARDEFEKLLININQIGEHFNFNNDFLMRTCLVLTDCQVLFKVETFKEENIHKIRNSWGQISETLKDVVKIISEFGFNGENLLSHNAIIPICYHVFKGGKTDNSSKYEIKKYLISSLLKKVFSAKGDAVLRTIRVAMRNEIKLPEGVSIYELKNTNFDFSMFSRIKLPGDHRFTLSDEDLEDLFHNPKGAYTFMILSLLYPQFKWNTTVIHQDHIHPSKSFSKGNLKELGLNDNEITLWQRYADQLPNLELLYGNENESKNDSAFVDWISKQPDIIEYRKRNYIPNTSCEFNNFIDFFTRRKDIMKNEIKQILK